VSRRDVPNLELTSDQVSGMDDVAEFAASQGKQVFDLRSAAGPRPVFQELDLSDLGFGIGCELD
jgi:hypothetical protein